MKPPVIVIEGPEDAFARALDEVRASGWSVRAGFDGAAIAPARHIRYGVVNDSRDAALALIAVLGGAGAVIDGRASRVVLDRLFEDLRHVGAVDYRRGSLPPIPALDDDAIAIFAILAAGRTLGDAAASLGLSRRTADRRLAEGRRALEVERTVEAIAKVRRLGLLD